ncbi:cyclase family protein [Methanobacterium sp.]|uniref:cyclase family protein n=1 Tax=Methanobacterium sp. TaxID=2164 RepID=UPI003C786D41
MGYITLSYMLEEISPVHMGLKKPEITHNNQIVDGKGYNTYLINVENHSGTHVDAPGHFTEDGKIISDYHPDELVFNKPLIVDIPKGSNELIKIWNISKLDFNDADCILFRTGFEKFHSDDSEKYLTQNPGISPEVVYFIRKNLKNVRCIGIDCVSISSYQNPGLGEEAHSNAFVKSKDFGKPLLLIEDMKLRNVKNEDLESIIIVPWQIKGIDSAPCTVLAKVK